MKISKERLCVLQCRSGLTEQEEALLFAQQTGISAPLSEKGVDCPNKSPKQKEV